MSECFCLTEEGHASSGRQLLTAQAARQGLQDAMKRRKAFSLSLRSSQPGRAT